MYTLKEYSDLLRRLVPLEAFVRLDRGEGLFVSDYPLRCPGFTLTDPEFTAEIAGGLAHIKPCFAGAPETLKKDLDTTATVKDIAENPYNIAFSEAEAALLPSP